MDPAQVYSNQDPIYYQQITPVPSAQRTKLNTRNFEHSLKGRTSGAEESDLEQKQSRMMMLILKNNQLKISKSTARSNMLFTNAMEQRNTRTGMRLQEDSMQTNSFMTNNKGSGRSKTPFLARRPKTQMRTLRGAPVMKRTFLNRVK